MNKENRKKNFFKTLFTKKSLWTALGSAAAGEAINSVGTLVVTGHFEPEKLGTGAAIGALTGVINYLRKPPETNNVPNNPNRN